MKKILKSSLIALVLIMTLTSILFVLKDDKKVVFADKVSTNYSKIYDDNVIFSVEKVKVKIGGEPTTVDEQSNYEQMLVPDGDDVDTNFDSKYFKNISRFISGTYKDKYVISNNEFVMIDDDYNVTDIDKEVVMVSLGAYSQYDNTEYLTNTITADSELKSSYDQNLQLINFSYFRINGTDCLTSDFFPATREFVINGRVYYDFVMFIDISDENFSEGFYELSFSYSRNESGTVINSDQKTFSFYLLSEKSYNDTVTVNGEDYNTAPTFENTTTRQVSSSYGYKNNEINTFGYTANNYPSLTYDYRKYQLSYEKTIFDVTKTVDYTFDEVNQKIVMTEVENGVTTTTDYPLDDFDNSLITLVFTELGEYEFSFNVIFQYNNVAQKVSDNQVPVAKQRLVMYGNTLAYSKSNIDRELKYIEISQNDINIIAPNAITLTQSLSENTNYGTIYKLVSDDTARNGIIVADSEQSSNAIDFYSCINTTEKIVTDNGLISQAFVKTSYVPLWFDQNATYSTNSFYYYSTVKANILSTTKKVYQKGQTFSNVGYYIVAIESTKSFDYTDISSEERVDTLWQLYVFQITTKLPEVIIHTTNDSSLPATSTGVIFSNKYTNQNVYLEWTNPGYFEAPITSTYWYSASYSDTKTGNGTIFSKDSALFSQSGRYIVEVFNGQKKTIIFTIDKQPITNLAIKGVTSTSTTTGNINYVFSGTTYNKAVLDKMVTLMYDDKTSGAIITTKYTYTPFVLDESITPSEISTNLGRNLWVATDYRLGKTQSEKTFTKVASMQSNISPDNIFAESGLYAFTLTDEAGNTCKFMFVIDKTLASFVQVPASTSANNLVAEDTTITWGSHKAIKLFDTSTLKNVNYSTTYQFTTVTDYILALTNGGYYSQTGTNLTEIQKLFTTYNSDYYYLVKNNYVYIEPLTTNSVSYTVLQDTLTTQRKLIKIESEVGNPLSGDNYYNIYIVGDNQVDINSTNYTTSISKMSIEFNSDNSLGMIYGSQEIDEDIYEYNNRIYTFDNSSENGYLYGDASKRETFVFEWLEGSGSFLVESVSYSYYPYDYSTNSTHPFATTPTIANQVITGERVLTSDASRENKLQSGAINTTAWIFEYNEFGSVIGSKRVTAPGKYVIKRSYVTGGGSEKDPQDRYYTFYVDRNGILTYENDETAVGKYICVSMQDGEKVYNNFSTIGQTAVDYRISNDNSMTMDSISAVTYFETNILPASILIPVSKYVLKTEMTSYISPYRAFGLRADIYYVDTATLTAYKVLSNVGGNLDGSQFNISLTGYSELSKPGVYVVKINDLVGDRESDTIVNNNELTFAFKILGDKPTGDFYSKPSTNEVAHKLEMIDNATEYTNNEKLTFEIVDPIQEYKAKIDTDNFVVYRREVGASTWEQYLVRRSGETDVSPDLNTFSVTELVENERYKYTIELNVPTSLVIASNGVITDYLQYEYKIDIHYRGNATAYQYTDDNSQTVSFYSNSLYTTVDRNAPSVNISARISNDATDITELYDMNASAIVEEKAYRNLYGSEESFAYDDYYSTLMTEYYAFAITSSTQYQKTNENDVEKVYFRRLAVYESDVADLVNAGDSLALIQQKSKPSLLPSDSRYYSADYDTYLRFSEASTLYSSEIDLDNKTYADILIRNNEDYGYYEVIEKDHSGNLTSYVVFYNGTPTDNPITLIVGYKNIVADSEDDVVRTATLSNNNNNLTGYYIVLNSINNIDQFSKITFTQATSTGSTNYTYYTYIGTDFNAIITDINSKIGYGTNTITITNRFGADLIVRINKFDINNALNINAITVTDYNGTLSINPSAAITHDIQSNLEFSISSLKLVAKNSSGNYVETPLASSVTDWNNGLTTDSYSCLELADLDSWDFQINLNRDGYYKLILTDMLGNSSVKYIDTGFVEIDRDFFIPNINVSLSLDTQQSQFVPRPDDTDYFFTVGNVYYTTKPVIIQYYGNQYSTAEIYRYNELAQRYDLYSAIGNDLSVRNSVYSVIDVNNSLLKDLVFMPPNYLNGFASTGGKYIYRVVLKSEQDESEQTYNFVIDNSSPQVNFYNMNRENKNNIATVNSTISYNTTSEALLITWGEFTSQNFVNKVILSKKIINSDNTTSWDNTDITSYYDSGYTISPIDSEGTFVLHLYTYNPTNNVAMEDRYFAFTIRQSDNFMYTIVYKDHQEDAMTDYQQTTTWAEIKEYIGSSANLPLVVGSRLSDQTEIPLYMSTQELQVLTNADRDITLTCIVAPSSSSLTSLLPRYNDALKTSGYKLYLYRIHSTDSSGYIYEEYVAITKVPVASDNGLNTSTNGALLTTFLLNDARVDSTINLLSQNEKYLWIPKYDSEEEVLLDKIAFNSYYRGNASTDSDMLVQKNPLIMDVYYNNTLVYSTNGTIQESENFDISTVQFATSGKYILMFRDLAGNKKVFTRSNYNYDSFALTVERDLLITVNDLPVVENAMYNGAAKVTINNPDTYKAGSIQFDVIYNGTSKSYARSPYSYTFTTPGFYKIVASAIVTYYVGQEKNELTLTNEFVFTIIDSDEARIALDFTNINNLYEIQSVTHKDNDVTSLFLGLLNGIDLAEQDNGLIKENLITYDRLKNYSKINSLINVGKYTFTYLVNGDKLVPSQTISVTFWINAETPSILSSISAGESTTKNIVIKFNPYIINQQVGNCSVVVNDTVYMTIGENAQNALSEITLTTNDTYYIQIRSDSGMIISSFKVIKKAPLNTVSIILIVLACLIVVGGTTVFIILRTKVRVR